MNTRLTDEEIDIQLTALDGWVYESPDIKKSFKFGDFKQAMSFIMYVALCAEQADHHPAIYNMYATVDIALHTHSAAGITQKDIDLARAIEAYFMVK
jgi:Pterin-4a-carbinolamine dehydratase